MGGRLWVPPGVEAGGGGMMEKGGEAEGEGGMLRRQIKEGKLLHLRQCWVVEHCTVCPGGLMCMPSGALNCHASKASQGMHMSLVEQQHIQLVQWHQGSEAG